MASFSRIALENWLKTIDVKCDQVLDIGGSQNPIKGRTRSWDVREYKILDLTEPHQCKQKPDITHDLNLSLYQSLSGARARWWITDVVFAIELLEYIWNPIRTIENINLLLKEGGLLYLTVHFSYGLHNPKGEDCLRYTRFGIEKLLTYGGFEILEMIPRMLSEEGKRHLINFYKCEGMRLDYSDPETYVEGYLVKAKKI